MRKEIRIYPRNSVVLIMDRTVGEVPESMNRGLVAATASCVAIGTRSEQDGETSIWLSDDIAEAVYDEAPVYDGVLDTPGGRLSVRSVLDEVLLECEVSGPRTRIQVWTNDRSEPDEIRIVVTGALKRLP